MYVDTEIEEDLRLLRRELLLDVVYATSYSSFLRNKPIAVSIKTKKSGCFKEAVLQIDVWQAANWAYLDYITKKRNTVLEGFVFLPGLIVSGADWYSVVSTRREQTTLWKKKLIGSMESLMETYKVVWKMSYPHNCLV
ncbi:hypothetical protein Ct61P_15111 [Colletotrichum tofieldiae]|nr:hypothetical protein Ct61P_15111 [Colletotrichum tofieldiae]